MKERMREKEGECLCESDGDGESERVRVMVSVREELSKRMLRESEREIKRSEAA